MNFTKKELELMNILWDAEQSMTAKQIHEVDPDFVLSTIQVTLSNLLKKGAIEVQEVKYSGKALTRAFAPIITREDFIVEEFANIDMSKLVSSFLGRKRKKRREDEIEKIEHILEDAKKKLKK